MKKFWGAEVKPGEPLMVTPEDNIIHISQASLDYKGKMGETVVLSVKVDGTKLVIGTLSQDKFPQISFDLAFEKNFELSHNCTKASVHFIGYKYPVPAPVAANRNAGAASTVVKADSKPKAKPEEVKPETDDDSDDKDDDSDDKDDDSEKGMEVDEDDSTDQRTAKPEEVKPESDDDESYDYDDSEKGMDEDDSTDQRTVEAATRKSKRESDDDDDSVMGIAKKQKKVDENPDPSNVSDEETTTDEDAFIGVCQPTKIGVLNLGHHITENDIMKFFESTVEPQSVLFQYTRDENGIIVKTDAVVEFQTAEQATLALKLKGEPLLGEPAYLARASNSRITVGIAGFNNELPEPTIKQQIIDRFHQSECGKVLQVFLPKTPITLNIGFAYVLLDQSGVKEAEKKLAKVDVTPIGEYHIMTWVAELKLSVYKAKMGLGTIQEGDATPYLEKKDLLYIAEFQKFLDTIPPPDQLPEPSTISFSWRNVRRDLFGPPGVQRACDCWARALSKGHSAALKLAGSTKAPVTKNVLLQSIDKRHQISGTGLIGMKYAKHFMESSLNCKEMVIYKRPVTDNYDDYEQFEETIISLLEASERGGAPLAVTIDFLPSYGYFEGTGIYYAIDLDFMRRAHENLPLHVLFLSGHGYQVIGGVKREFWELQESKGSDFGDAGFVKIARHQCIIKKAYVFKV